MNKADKYYKENLKNILTNGSLDIDPRPRYKDGKPAHTKFITQVFETYDLSKGEFPITTLRNTAIKTGIKEIFWIYQEQSNNLDTAETMGIKWWDEWDIGNRSIGQRYGATVKRYNLMDKLLYNLEHYPFARRHIMNMYQETDLLETDGLFPCAYETLWSVRQEGDDRILDMTLIQRSNDYIMAGYINKTQYVALQMMVAGHLGYKLGNFCHLVQNLHIYDRHIDAAIELLARHQLDDHPTIILKENKNFYDYTMDDFVITDPVSRKIISPLEIAI
tara:strand:- start:41259 stop:42086 length:828 start_codon:yes stop_codon:yes gene_type:complete